jgi:hypothetical protein
VIIQVFAGIRFPGKAICLLVDGMALCRQLNAARLRSILQLRDLYSLTATDRCAAPASPIPAGTATDICVWISMHGRQIEAQTGSSFPVAAARRLRIMTKTR